MAEGVSRRTLAQGAAWSVPVMAAAAAAPAAVASTTPQGFTCHCVKGVDDPRAGWRRSLGHASDVLTITVFADFSACGPGGVEGSQINYSGLALGHWIDDSIVYNDGLSFHYRGPTEDGLYQLEFSSDLYGGYLRRPDLQTPIVTANLYLDYRYLDPVTGEVQDCSDTDVATWWLLPASQFANNGSGSIGLV